MPLPRYALLTAWVQGEVGILLRGETGCIQVDQIILLYDAGGGEMAAALILTGHFVLLPSPPRWKLQHARQMRFGESSS